MDRVHHLAERAPSAAGAPDSRLRVRSNARSLRGRERAARRWMGARRARRAVKKLLVLLAFVACAPKDFTPASFVDTLRVLAVRADKPFAAPGENVQLTALVVDPNGKDRPIAFAFGTCINPGSGEIP